MKRIFSFSAIFMLIFLGTGVLKSFSASNVQETNAVSSATTYTWSEKLKRGGLNIISSPVEIARSIQVTSNEETLLKGWTIGLVKGFGDGFLRLGAGLVDVVTCPFNFPDANKGPLIQPEYVWQKQGLKYS